MNVISELKFELDDGNDGILNQPCGFERSQVCFYVVGSLVEM